MTTGGTAKDAMESWKKSQRHYRNLLAERHVCGAIACYKDMWIAIFYDKDKSDFVNWKSFQLKQITVKRYDSASNRYIAGSGFAYYEESKKNDTLKVDKIPSSEGKVVYLEIGKSYDNPDISIYEAVNDIVEDLKQKPDTNGTKGAITAESELYPLNCEEFLDELERKSKVEPVLTFTVAECGEFHQLGEYYDDITTVEEAIEKWEQLKDSPLNGVASIGILSHKPGGNSLEDEQVDLVTRKVLDLDMLRYYPTIRNDKRALEMIAALASYLPDIDVIGEIPYELSLQMMLYELDPEKEIFSEDERALIEEYALQFGDMNRSRELAEHICYQEEYGNQDVAPVVIEARREIQEKKEEHLHQKKR